MQSHAITGNHRQSQAITCNHSILFCHHSAITTYYFAITNIHMQSHAYYFAITVQSQNTILQSQTITCIHFHSHAITVQSQYIHSGMTLGLVKSRMARIFTDSLQEVVTTCLPNALALVLCMHAAGWLGCSRIRYRK